MLGEGVNPPQGILFCVFVGAGGSLPHISDQVVLGVPVLIGSIDQHIIAVPEIAFEGSVGHEVVPLNFPNDKRCLGGESTPPRDFSRGNLRPDRSELSVQDPHSGGRR